MNTFLLFTPPVYEICSLNVLGQQARQNRLFGVWADAASDHRMRREALRILIKASGRCFEQDMRNCRDTNAALTYLSSSVSRAGCLRFRKALNQPDPYEREQAARQACEFIARSVLGRPLAEADWN